MLAVGYASAAKRDVLLCGKIEFQAFNIPPTKPCPNSPSTARETDYVLLPLQKAPRQSLPIGLRDIPPSRKKLLHLVYPQGSELELKKATGRNRPTY